jgi:hypothetical protein
MAVPKMTMRDRIMAVLEGREHDRVPLVIYDGMLPLDEVRRVVGPGRIGVMRWTGIHRVETPNCRTEVETFVVGGTKWERNTIHTAAGSMYEERAYEPVYNTSRPRKYFVSEPEDYEVLWAYLEDGVILEDYDWYHREDADLGDEGIPLAAIERTPYQQLWVQWVGLSALSYHMADYPDRVSRTIELLNRRAREVFEIAYYAPAPFIDFPDNITAPTIGLDRFEEYCVPLYNELADMLAERDALVFVHMDGDLKPLWGAISDSRVGGIDSLAPTPDNDTSVAQAVSMWPDKLLYVNYPSSVHLGSSEEIYTQAQEILEAAGHTRHLQIQISENVPFDVWRQSLPVIAAAIDDFGVP